jgi:uncharacterized protein YciI
VKYAVFYESADDVLAMAPPRIPAHSAHMGDFRARGTLLMGGAYANPQEGALMIFTGREAAEEFARGDPYVLNGGVRNWRIQEWNETVAGR